MQTNPYPTPHILYQPGYFLLQTKDRSQVLINKEKHSNLH
jgi:hypothetical protein